MADVDRALAFEPRNIGVLIPRAAVLLVAARNQRDPARARDLATRAATGFETALALRQGAFAGLAQHNRGEYLSGLAESWALAGNQGKAEDYLERILVELPGSPYAERATAKLADWSDRKPLNCQGGCRADADQFDARADPLGPHGEEPQSRLPDWAAWCAASRTSQVGLADLRTLMPDQIIRR